MTIWKFPLSLGLTEVEMPAGAKVLCMDVQQSVPTLWAEVDQAAPIETRAFNVVGTGHTIPEKANYVGTCFQRSPSPPFFPNGFVWHVYEMD